MLTHGHVLTEAALQKNERNHAWLARHLDVSSPAVCRWFTLGHRPNETRRERIRDMFGVPISAWDRPAKGGA